MVTTPRRARTTLQFAMLALTWGSSFLFIKVGLEGLEPVQVVLARLWLGALALTVLMVRTRTGLPRELAVWGHLTVVAVLFCVVPFLLFAMAERQISSGLASILNATTPLQTLLFALVALPQERPTLARVAGLGLGLVGVLTVLGAWSGAVTAGSGGHLGAELACLAATACYGAAFVYMRRFVSARGLPAVQLAWVQIGLAAVIASVASTALITRAPHPSARVVASMVALGVLGTGLAYVWNTNVVQDWGATSASTVTYLTPVVGVLLGVAVLGERFAWNQPLGAVLVVVGIAVGQGRLRRRPSLRQVQAAPSATASPECLADRGTAAQA